MGYSYKKFKFIFGTWKDDVLNGTDCNDIMFGFCGDDIMNGGGGHDWMFGGWGDDTMDGGGAMMCSSAAAATTAWMAATATTA